MIIIKIISKTIIKKIKEDKWKIKTKLMKKTINNNKMITNINNMIKNIKIKIIINLKIQ